jgi:hypothetical protein
LYKVILADSTVCTQQVIVQSIKLVRNDIYVNEHEILSNITPIHRLMKRNSAMSGSAQLKGNFNPPNLRWGYIHINLIIISGSAQ